MKRYRPKLTVTVNTKGCIDIDTVKGCTCGMAAHGGGCYGRCYAALTAKRYGIDFKTSVPRLLPNTGRQGLFNLLARQPQSWYRIGVAGDPSHYWKNTVSVCEFFGDTGKIPVIITKHWVPISKHDLERLKAIGAVFNTSVSALDSDLERCHRIHEMLRIRDMGMTSVCRVVTCQFTDKAKNLAMIQNYLLSLTPVIDTPLRTIKNDHLVVDGLITITRPRHSIGGGSKWVSLHDANIYLGTCSFCPDQCGVTKGENDV